MPPAFNLSQDQTLQFDLVTYSKNWSELHLHENSIQWAFKVHETSTHQQYLSISPTRLGTRLLTPTLIGCWFLKSWAFTQLAFAKEYNRLAVAFFREENPHAFYAGAFQLIAWRCPTFTREPALSLAQRRFTVLFGMGRSGTTSLWSSGLTCCLAAF